MKQKKIYIVKYKNSYHEDRIFGVFSKEKDAKEATELINKGYYIASGSAWMIDYDVDDDTNKLLIDLWKMQQEIESTK